MLHLILLLIEIKMVVCLRSHCADDNYHIPMKKKQPYLEPEPHWDFEGPEVNFSWGPMFLYRPVFLVFVFVSLAIFSLSFLRQCFFRFLLV